MRGDALDLLPKALAALPPEGTVCLYHSFTLNQFSADARARFLALLDRLGRERPIARIGLEWGTAEAPELTLIRHDSSGAVSQRLALCDAHGGWLAWLSDTA